MDFIVYLLWRDSQGTHEEYRQFPVMEEAKHYADYKRKCFSNNCGKNVVFGYNVKIYEQTNY